MIAKPFLKWAGGKTQLIDQIRERLPSYTSKETFTYIEPFVGSGAVLFWMLNNFPNINQAVINDVNKDLTDCYLSIKHNVTFLIEVLKEFEIQYHNLSDKHEEKKEFYKAKRTLFNSRSSEQVVQSAIFIFLNRTCFNGLYRVNKKNEFNVPIGSYKRPVICNSENLQVVSQVLQRVTILNGDYTQTLEYANDNTLFYFDPPYKPLSNTSSFNSYAKDEFDDDEQIRLRNFCNNLDNLGYQWILSNSDIKSKNPEDNFFDDLYAKYNIKRVFAKRTINSKPSKRGFLTELLISNN